MNHGKHYFTISKHSTGAPCKFAAAIFIATLEVQSILSIWCGKTGKYEVVCLFPPLPDLHNVSQESLAYMLKLGGEECCLLADMVL